MDWTSFLSPNQQCQSTNESQSTDHNHWPRLILSSSTTGLLMEGALVYFLQLFWENLLGMNGTIFEGPDILPVTQPTVSKH